MFDIIYLPELIYESSIIFGVGAGSDVNFKDVIVHNSEHKLESSKYKYGMVK